VRSLRTKSSYERKTKIADMGVGCVLQDTGPGSTTLNHAYYALLSSLNYFTSFLSKLPLQQLIRLVWIIGGYILLRPYLELGFRKLFATQENDSDTIAEAAEASPVKGEPLENSRAGITTGSTAWGAAARKRQAIILESWEKEQARLVEEHDLDGVDPDLLED
jgi:Protein trafficking PGA2